jgi:hypothetical protein
MKKLNLIFVLVIVYSCLNENSSLKKGESYITSFKLILSNTPNPDAAVFRIHSDIKLNELLLSEKWDSICFSGGLFDTINFNHRIIFITKTEMPNDLILGMRSADFLTYSQSQMDSIASKTFEKVEVIIYYKTDKWKLKPRGKNEGKL